VPIRRHRNSSSEPRLALARSPGRPLALVALLSALAACEGPAGRQGPAGAGSPAIAAVSPWQAFPARTLDVMVSGTGTQFDASTTADFGAGVTVSSVRLMDPTRIVCTVTVAPDAPVGFRDVTVTGGGSSLVAAGAFEVIPSLAVDTGAGGPILQGDIVDLALFSLDDQPLWQDPDQPTAWPDGMTLVDWGMQNGVALRLALVDVFAATGPRPLAWTNVGVGGRTFVADPAVLSVGARSPVVLAVPSTTSVEFDTRSKLFDVATSQLGILSVGMSSMGSALWPSGMLLPESGQTSAALDFQVAMANGRLAALTGNAAATTYVVIGGNPSAGAGAAYTATLDVLHTPVAAATPESTTAHDPTAPQAVTPPAIVEGALATGFEVDAYAVSVPAGSVLEIAVSPLAATVNVSIYMPTGSIMTAPGYWGAPSFTIRNGGSTGTYRFALAGRGTPVSYAVGFKVY
jgi:hypothetical protein